MSNGVRQGVSNGMHERPQQSYRARFLANGRPYCDKYYVIKCLCHGPHVLPIDKIWNLEEPMGPCKRRETLEVLKLFRASARPLLTKITKKSVSHRKLFARNVFLLVKLKRRFIDSGRHEKTAFRANFVPVETDLPHHQSE